MLITAAERPATQILQRLGVHGVTALGARCHGLDSRGAHDHVHRCIDHPAASPSGGHPRGRTGLAFEGAAEGLDGPAYRAPGGDVEDVTAINDVFARHQPGHGRRVEIAEFLPFGCKDNQFAHVALPRS